jgi:hypothetical protein
VCVDLLQRRFVNESVASPDVFVPLFGLLAFSNGRARDGWQAAAGRALREIDTLRPLGDIPSSDVTRSAVALMDRLGHSWLGPPVAAILRDHPKSESALT